MEQSEARTGTEEAVGSVDTTQTPEAGASITSQTRPPHPEQLPLSPLPPTPDSGTLITRDYYFEHLTIGLVCYVTVLCQCVNKTACSKYLLRNK